MKYYIGVDGGGTKTAFALFDENKNVIAQNETEGSNHENLEGAIPQAAGIIAGGINGLLEKASLKFDDISGILMGLAGIDHPYQHDAMVAELEKLDFGSKFSERFKGLGIVKFEDILKKFAGHTIMNIHVKTVNNTCAYDEELLKKICGNAIFDQE